MMDDDIERQVREIDRAYFLSLGVNRLIEGGITTRPTRIFFSEGHEIPLSHPEKPEIFPLYEKIDENRYKVLWSETIKNKKRRRRIRNGRKI